MTASGPVPVFKHAFVKDPCTCTCTWDTDRVPSGCVAPILKMRMRVSVTAAAAGSTINVSEVMNLRKLAQARPTMPCIPLVTDMYAYTEQSQDKLRKMKAGIHREVLYRESILF